MELTAMLAFEHAVLSLSAVSSTLSFVLLLADASDSIRAVELRVSDRTLSMITDTLAENDDDSLTKRRLWWELCFDTTTGEMYSVAIQVLARSCSLPSSSIANKVVRVHRARSQPLLPLCLLRRI